jgi:hypothetical protein
MLGILSKLIKRANGGSKASSAFERQEEATRFLAASAVAEPAGVVRRQLIALCFALGIFATVVSSYCAVTVPEAWDDGGVSPKGVTFDADHLTNDAMATRDTTVVRVRAPSAFAACDIVVYADEAVLSAGDEVVAWSDEFRSSLLKRALEKVPGTDSNGPDPARCTSAVSVQLRGANAASAAAASKLRSPSADRDKPASLAHVNGRLTLTILLEGNADATDGDKPLCAGRVVHSRAAHAFCVVNAAVTSAAASADAVANRIRIDRAPPRAPPSHLLRRVAKHYNDVPSSMAGLVEEMVMDSVGPKDAAELRDTIEHLLPAAAPQLTTPGWALQRALRRERRHGQKNADPEDMAAAMLGDPHWTTALLLPPEQLLALHMPIYLPLTVSLFGACRVLLRKVIAARRRRRKDVAAEAAGKTKAE